MLMLDPIIDIEMNLEDINNFIVEKHLLDVSPVSIDNPNEIFKLLFKIHSRLHLFKCLIAYIINS